MPTPTPRVRIAFGVLPADGEPSAGQWIDVSAYAQEIHLRRGRSQDLDRIEASTATVVFQNNDARFTPGNTAGPYSPNVRPFAQIELAWTLGAAVTVMFRGLIERWTPSWYTRQGGTCTIECVDLFRYLELTELNATPTPLTLGTSHLGQIDATLYVTYTFPEQTAGARIAAVLTAIGNPWPTSIDTTGVTMASATITANTLAHILDVAEKDSGLFYQRPSDGKLVYLSGWTLRAAATWTTSQATFGDGAGELNYETVSISTDEQQIQNRILGRNAGGFQITPVEDTTSQSRYTLRLLDFGATEMVTLGHVVLRAYRELAIRGNPRQRVDGLRYNILDPGLNTTTLLGLDLLHRVTVIRRPDQGDVLSAAYLVQGLQHDIQASPSEWKMNVSVSNVPIELELWVLNQSALGTGTVLRAE